MAEPRDQWTKSQIGAFPYIQQGVGLGMTATDALIDYRAGGGKIGNELWFSLFKQEFSFSGVRENIIKIPMTYTVPDSMFEPVDYDFREQYVMQMKVRGFSSELDMWVTRWVTAESDTMLTKQEWQYAANMAISDRIGSPPLVVSSVVEWTPLQRSGYLKI